MLRIKEAREARGWTQEQLAAEMNTTQQTIQRWESGQTDPKASVIKEISRVLGITVSFIMNIEDEGNEVEGLSTDERKLLKYYRQLPNDRKRMVRNVAKAEWLDYTLETGGEEALAAEGYRLQKMERGQNENHG